MGAYHPAWQQQLSRVGVVTLRFLFCGIPFCALIIAVYSVWLLVETLVAMVVFPIRAIFEDEASIRDSWLGRYPNAFTGCLDEGLPSVTRIWEWVMDPSSKIDLELDGDSEKWTVDGSPIPWRLLFGTVLIAIILGITIVKAHRGDYALPAREAQSDR
jgi:hypothetical protein